MKPFPLALSLHAIGSNVPITFCVMQSAWGGSPTCRVARCQFSKCHFSCCKGHRNWMHGLGGCRLLRAQASHWSPLLFQSSQLICLLLSYPIDCAGCTFYLWINSVVMKNFWVYTFNFDYNSKFYVICFIFNSDQNFWFSSGIQQISASKLDSGGSKKNMHHYMRLFYLRYLYAYISFKARQRNLSVL